MRGPRLTAHPSESAAATSAATANYASTDGTATAGSDYVAASGTLTLAIGESTKTVTVTVNGDTTVEPDETLTIGLSAAVGATLADASGAGTLENDDSVMAPALPPMSIGNVTVQQGGESPRVEAVFTITVSAPSADPVTVTDSALNSAGVREGTARMTERPRIEDFTVFLRDASVATIDRARGQGSIVDDDGPPSGSGGGGGSVDAVLLAMLALCLFLPQLRARRRAAMGRRLC